MRAAGRLRLGELAVAEGHLGEEQIGAASAMEPFDHRGALTPAWDGGRRRGAGPDGVGWFVR